MFVCVCSHAGKCHALSQYALSKGMGPRIAKHSENGEGKYHSRIWQTLGCGAFDRKREFRVKL